MGQPIVSEVNFIGAVQRKLNGIVVGYSGVIGGGAGVPRKDFPGGHARTSANGQPVVAGPSTMFPIASVSKLLTATAAVQLLDGPMVDGAEVPQNILGATLDSPIAAGLPKNWKLRPDALPITYRDLLAHTSGLAAEGSTNEPGQDYFSLKNYLTEETLPLGPRGVYAYSNVGFALFRLLLPKLAGIIKDSLAVPEQELAHDYAVVYQQIINQKVFGPVGVTGPLTETPEDSTHAFAYNYPGTSSGYDWSVWKYPGQTWPGDGQLLWAGSGCWWVSIDQLAPVLESISNVDGRILTPAQWQHMQAIGAPSRYANLGLGIDELTYTQGGQTYRWVEKNGGGGGGDETGSGSVSAAIAIFGAPDGNTGGPSYAALFINSDISGGTGSATGWYYCSSCGALATPKNGGACPATGAAHVSLGQYVLSSAPQPQGQGNWSQCSKCGALCSEANGTDPSVCAADGQRHAPIGETFILSQTGESTPGVQADWRWCLNCGVLAYSGGSSFGGVCAAGANREPHQFLLSDSNYALNEVLGADSVLLAAFMESQLWTVRPKPGNG